MNSSQELFADELTEEEAMELVESEYDKEINIACSITEVN